MKKQYSHKKENIAIKKMHWYIDLNIYLTIVIFLPSLWIYHDVILNRFSTANEEFINLTTIVLTCFLVFYIITLITTMLAIFIKKAKDKNFKQAYKFLLPKFVNYEDDDKFLTPKYRQWIRKNSLFEFLACQIIFIVSIIFMISTIFIFKTDKLQIIIFLLISIFLVILTSFLQFFTIFFYWRKSM